MAAHNLANSGEINENLGIEALSDLVISESESVMIQHSFDQDPQNPLYLNFEVYKDDPRIYAYLSRFLVISILKKMLITRR